MEYLKKFLIFNLKIITLINYLFVKKKYKKIIFLHIPHSGGNTLHKFLKINFGFRGKKIILNHLQEIDNIEDGKKHFYNFGHFGLDFIKKNYVKENNFYFFNIRKPQNFYLSNYFRDKRYNSIYTPNNEFPSLKDFLVNIKKENKDNIYCRYLSGKFIYKKNSVNFNSEIFNSAVENLKFFNFIYILENNSQNIKELSKKLEIPIDFSLFFNLHLNKHSDSNYPSINQDDKEILETLVNYDNELYKHIINKTYNEL